MLTGKYDARAAEGQRIAANNKSAVVLRRNIMKKISGPEELNNNNYLNYNTPAVCDNIFCMFLYTRRGAAGYVPLLLNDVPVAAVADDGENLVLGGGGDSELATRRQAGR